MKKRVWIFFGILAVLVTARWWWGVRSDAGYISRISGVHIPFAAWPVDSYELDWCIVAKYRVSKAAARMIASEHLFVPLATLNKGIEKKFEPTLLKWLVSHGASPDVADRRGVSPRMKASRKRDKRFLAALA